MKSHKPSIVLVLLLVLARSSPGTATVIQRKSFKELVVEAQLVAVGNVSRVEAISTTGQSYAYTYVTVSDLEVLKGSYSSPEITLRTDGGPLANGRTLVVAGMPRFRESERVVVFVKGNGQQICPLVGWGQGLLRVVADGAGGSEVVTTSSGARIRAIQGGEFVLTEQPALPGVLLLGGTAGGQGAIALVSAAGVLTLDGLKVQVKSLAGQVGTLSQNEVKSAEITLTGPELRTSKTIRREE